MMQGSGQMNPLMMKIMQMMQQQYPMNEEEYPIQGHIPDMMDQSTVIPQGSDMDESLQDAMGGQRPEWQNQMPYDREQTGEDTPVMSRQASYGPIGNRMERMRPTLVHDRKKVQGMFPKGIPEDVEGATQEMENAPDAMGQIKAHKHQHKFMKGHLKEGIGRIQAERSGESVDSMFQKLQEDLVKLKEQRAKRSAK